MRKYLLLLSVAFSLTAWASEPEFDIREMEDQFTQSTLDAKLIEQVCAQSRTATKTCYQRTAGYTAQCRQQLKQQYVSRGIDSYSLDREQKVTDLQNCVQQMAQDAVSR